MGQKQKIQMSNREAIDRRVGLALGYLATQNAVGFTLALQIADLQTAIEAQVARFEKAKRMLFESHGATKKGNDILFTEDKPAPDAFYEELEKLETAVVEHDLEQIDLPRGPENKYQPVIFSMLGRFIKK